MHFSKIIHEQYLYKALKCNAMYGVLSQIEAQLSLKNACYPQFPFWIPRSPTKFGFLRIVLNRAKISLY